MQGSHDGASLIFPIEIGHVVGNPTATAAGTGGFS
jgi:hypothetical protein